MAQVNNNGDETKEKANCADEGNLQRLDWDDEIFLNPHQSALETGRAQGREAGRKAGFLEGQTLGRIKGLEFGIEIGFIRGVLDMIEALPSSSDNDFRSQKWLHDRCNDSKVERSLQALKSALNDFPDPTLMFETNVSLGIIERRKGQDDSIEDLRRNQDDIEVKENDEDHNYDDTKMQKNRNGRKKNENNNVDKNRNDKSNNNNNNNNSSNNNSSNNNSEIDKTSSSREKLDILYKMQRIRTRFRLLTVQLGIPHFSLKNLMDEAIASNDDSQVPSSGRQTQPVNGYDW